MTGTTQVETMAATTTERSGDRTIRVAIVGGSGYTGAELLRLAVGHPDLEIVTVTSNSQAGKRLDKIHPHLRGAPDEVRALKTVPHDAAATADVDAVFLAVPHGRAMAIAPGFVERGIKVLDLSADFRLRDPAAYPEWYGSAHSAPELLGRAAYGIAELHRDEYPGAALVSGAGCLATTAILSLMPLLRAGWVDTSRIVVDGKIGSSAAGVESNASSHHPDRSRAVRPYSMTGHRHTAEIEQELTFDGTRPQVHMSAHGIELVRGILTTSQLFLTEEHRDATERDIWSLYREAYGAEPFVRIVKERGGVHRTPDPRFLVGTNVCEVGFERDERSGRIVVIGALDNLTKGAAGAAVQNLNIVSGLPETTGLSTVGLYPAP